MLDINWYKGKNVFVTGHTGFKGAWLCAALLKIGANVYGYALEPPTSPNLFNLLDLKKHINTTIADIRNANSLSKAINAARPDVIIHMAAQPLVRDSYINPHYTYEVNVMGTVNILECLRNSPSSCSFVNVTTDKVYLNDEIPDHRFVEDEPLDGFDPYSNSKSCAELVTHCYKKSFFGTEKPSSNVSAPCAISTARAGNVIGGGDFSANRLIPDCVRAVESDKPLIVRNPHATRPYQHVLEPLFAYLMIAQRQVSQPSLAGWYNVGPDAGDHCSNVRLIEYFKKHWGEGFAYQIIPNNELHEANFLELENAKLRHTFGWQPRWSIEVAVEKTVEFTRQWLAGSDVCSCMREQINEYFSV